MKKFIIRLSIFCVTVFIFLIGFDMAVSSLLRKNSIVRNTVVWKEIFSETLQHDIVIMGSSRALVQYSPAVLDTILHLSGYNIGIDGRAINSQILRYNTYIRLNRKPKLVIQNIDMITIDKDDAYSREQFFPYFFDKTFRQDVVELENLSWTDKYIPGYRYGGYFHRILLGLGIMKQDELLEKGFFAVDRNWDGSSLEKIKEIEYRQDSISLINFDLYLNEVQRNGIQILFVYAPLYIGATEKIKNIEGMYQMYDSIARKYDIPILDYTYDSLSYDTAYFYNATHMNRQGAELFSTKLAHDIDFLGILK